MDFNSMLSEMARVQALGRAHPKGITGLLRDQTLKRLPSALKDDLQTFRDSKGADGDLDALTAALKPLKSGQLEALCSAHGVTMKGNKSEKLTRLLTFEEPKKRKRGPSSDAQRKKRAMSTQAVDKLLDKLGVTASSQCFKAALQRRHIVLDEDDPLETVVLEKTCERCDEPVVATARDLLDQPDNGGNDYCGECEYSTVRCKTEDCGYGTYVTGMCEGKASFDDGKFHNHCTECSGFGKCMHDYRMAHCDQCGKHWFCGNSGFPCPNCNPGENTFDDWPY